MSDEPLDFRGRQLSGADFSGAVLREASFRGARILGAEMVDVEIDAWVENLRINGVDVVPLIEAELDRLHPERLTLRSTDPEGVREAWHIVDDFWANTAAHVHGWPESMLQEQVDGEWSFVETLRHLVFVTDAWFGRTVLGLRQPFHRLGLPATFLDVTDLGCDLDARPSLADVMEARRARLEMVGDHLETITADELARVCAPNPHPGYPPTTEFTVLKCLHVVFDEEWAHHNFAIRDLEVLERRGASDHE